MGQLFGFRLLLQNLCVAAPPESCLHLQAER